MDSLENLQTSWQADRLPLCERVIAGFSGHIPALRTEAIVGYNFKQSVDQAEKSRPVPGSGAPVPDLIVKPMPTKAKSEGNLIEAEPKPQGFKLKDQISSTQVAVGYSGHVPGHVAAPWRWIGKPYIRGVNFNETFDNPWNQEVLKELGAQGPSSINPHLPRAQQPWAQPNNNVGVKGIVPGRMMQSYASWGSTGTNWQQHLPMGMDTFRNQNMAFRNRDARHQPISGYSGHVRGLVARNIVGASFVETVHEAKRSQEFEPGYEPGYEPLYQ